MSRIAIIKFGLDPKAHPRPYRISLVDQSNMPLTYRCQVLIQLASYQGHICCAISAMDVANVLLARPWLYDLDVTHYGHRNTYEYMFNG